MASRSWSKLLGAAVVSGAVLLQLGCSSTTVVARVPAERQTPATVEPAQIIVDAATAQRARRKPNVVVLMTDDQRADELRYMPKTRRLLGRAGITFDQALSPNPLCCPARAEFLTGQATHNNKVLSNDRKKYGGYSRLDPIETLPVWLQRQGYATAFTGKHLNGYNYRRDGIDPGWSQFNVLTKGVYNYDSWSALEKGKPVKRTGYVTDYLGSQTARFVKRFSRQDRPFFIWTAHVGPHTASGYPGGRWGVPRVPTRYQGRFTHKKFPLSSLRKPSFGENLSDKSRYYRGKAGRVDAAAAKKNHLARVGAIRAVDDNNAKVIRALRATGELKNTVVVFLSDNGYLLGEHNYTGKILGFEESLRVPLVVRGPGIAAGSRARQPVTLMDLTATLVRLAGARPTVPMDGQSLVPLLRQPRTPTVADTQLIGSGAYTAAEAKTSPWMYRGVRTARYTLIRYFNGEVELYDREKDPYQVTNVAGAARYAAALDDLTARYDALKSCAGKECTTSFGPDVKPAS